MGEARRPEVLTDILGQALVLAEDDAEDECALHPVRATPDGVLDSVAQAVTEARDAAAASDLTPAAAPEDHVDPLAREPGALVEAVLGTAWLRHAHDRLQDGAARRRAADREDQKRTLAQRTAAEGAGLSGHTDGPGRLACWPGHDELRGARLADLGRELAPPERVEPQRAPPETGGCEHDAERDGAGRAVEDGHADEGDHRERGCRRGSGGDPVREREPCAGRAGEQRRPVELDDSPHGVTSSRSCSMRAGPMPGTASRSSTDLNGPCSVR